MTSDSLVNHFRDECSAWNVLVRPEREAFSGTMPQSAKDSLGSGKDRTVRLDELDGAVEILRRYVGEARRRLLRGGVVDRLPCHLLPACYPEPAEAAVPVIDEQRLARRSGDAGSVRGGVHVRVEILSEMGLPSSACSRLPPRN